MTGAPTARARGEQLVDRRDLRFEIAGQRRLMLGEGTDHVDHQHGGSSPKAHALAVAALAIERERLAVLLGNLHQAPPVARDGALPAPLAAAS